MSLALLVALALMLAAGVLLGGLAGLLPGLHSNTLQSILLSLDLPLGDRILAVLMASLAFSRLAFEAIPSILLFIPDADTVVAMLPGHRLALEGKAGLALKVHAFSTLASAALAVFLFPVALLLLPFLYSAAKPFTAFFLVLASLAMVLSEKEFAKMSSASACFLLSGGLGVATLSLGLGDPFLPAFTGLFAIPAALFALKSDGKPAPQQKKEENEFGFRSFLPFILIGVILGFLADLFPGMGSAAQAALFASFFIPLNSVAFLSLAASVSSSHLLFSFAAVSSIRKARTGAAAAASSLFGELGVGELVLIAGVALISLSCSCAILFAFARRIADEFAQISHRQLNLLMLAFLPLLAFSLEGVVGISVLAVASLIGALPLISGVKRVHLLGFILIPALGYSLGLQS